jgi:RNA polymerase sigma factor (sigma-70 family)
MTEAAAPGPAAGDAPLRGSSGPLRLLSDERLARRAAKGERRAFEAIYRRYHEDLYRFCLATTGNPQDAQEALQNTMVKVLRALPGEERRIELKPWLYRIARNEAVETIRRRRDTAELAPEQASAGLGIAATAEARDRLRGLLADLDELPERQRAALVMRELAGLGFEQIGESLETSAQAARQTVYEARLGLRQLEAGREMGCDAVMRELSDGDGRVARRRDMRAHLRTCESCRAFRAGIAERRGGFAAIVPLPLAISAGLLQSALNVGGAGTAVATSAVAKSVATVAVVAAVGVTAADRGGLIDAPVLGGAGDAAPAGEAPGPAGGQAARGGEAGLSGAAGKATRVRASSRDAKARPGGGGKSGEAQPSGAPGRAVTGTRPPGPVPNVTRTGENGTGASRGHGRHRGRPDGLPNASKHGQETAAAHKAPQAQGSPGPGGTVGSERGGKSASKAATAPPSQKPLPSQQQKSSSSPVDPVTAAPAAAGDTGPPPQAGGGEKPSKP